MPEQAYWHGFLILSVCAYRNLASFILHGFWCSFVRMLWFDASFQVHWWPLLEYCIPTNKYFIKNVKSFYSGCVSQMSITVVVHPVSLLLTQTIMNLICYFKWIWNKTKYKYYLENVNLNLKCSLHNCGYFNSKKLQRSSKTGDLEPNGLHINHVWTQSRSVSASSAKESKNA